MGVGYKGAFDLFPTEIAGQKVEYIIRDDATDASTAYTIAQKMISEDHVDAFIGPSLTASDAAVAPLANQAKVPMLAMAPYEYDPQKQPYTFNDAQPLSLMVAAVFKYMQQRDVKTIGYIGFSDGWGDQVLASTKASASADGIQILADERYARTDTTCEAQALKLISTHPQAVMMGNSATPAALPVVALRHRGYKGGIYGNHGIVSPAFIKVGGTAVEGVIAVTSPVVVADELPASNPIKPVATTFVKDYTAKLGGGVGPFAGYSYDAFLLLQAAIPEALKAGKPGTEAFRVALRDALEKTHELVGVSGIYTMSPTDHNGQDSRAAVLVEVKDGAWRAIQ
jgi:branched-chain amino acid transport system substrate-binding protein